MTTITKGRQTIYIRDHDSLDPFEWAGGCSGLGSIGAPLGDVEWRDMYDPAAFFQGVPAIEVEAGPGPVGTTLSVKKSVRNALLDRWYRCRWDVDVRYQECLRRDDSTNWESITRLCDAKFLAYDSDGDEVITTQDDDGDMVISSPIKAPWPLVHLWRLTAALVDVTVTEDFTSIAVCEAEQCADAVGRGRGCTQFVGTSGYYGPPGVYRTDDGWATWEAFTLTGWHGDVEDIVCLGDFVVVVSAYDEAVQYSDDRGESWTEVLVDEDGNPLAGWGVGMWAPGCIVVVGENGRIWRSLDKARSWNLVTGGSQALYKVVPVNSQVWWAIGDSNTIVRSEDGAATWEVVTGPVLQTGVDVTAILALDEERILLGYADGTLWYTENGGEDWTQDASVVAFDEIEAFVECGCGRVVMVGYDADGDGLIYENVDGGAPGMWYAHDMPDGVGILADVICCGPNEYYAIGSGVYLSGQAGQIVKLE